MGVIILKCFYTKNDFKNSFNKMQNINNSKGNLKKLKQSKN